MKKVLYILFTIFLFTLNANAEIVIEKLGNEIITQNEIIIPVNISIVNQSSNLGTFSIKAIDTYIYKIANPKYNIPIDNLTLNDGNEDFQLDYNKKIILPLKDSLNNFNKTYFIKIENKNGFIAGNYNTRLELNYNDTKINNNEIYNLNFNVPIKQELTCKTQEIELNLTPEEIFNKKNRSQSAVTPQIFINSNTNWKLTIDATNFQNQKENYFFEIIDASEKIKEYFKSPIKLNDNPKIVIAKGDITKDENNSNQYILVKFYMENNQNDYIEANEFTGQIKYILDEDI